MEHSPAPAYEIRMLRAIRRIIRALLKEGALTMKRLSQLIDLSASTTVGVVDRLEVKGLVSRTRSTHDRRQVFVSITVDGEAMAKRSPFPLQSRLIDGFQKMPELEQATLTLAVESLVSLMGMLRLF